MFFWGLLLFCLPTALLLEVSVPIPLFGGVWGHFPWVTALVVYYALHQSLRAAFWAAVIGGILVDSFTLGQTGITLLLYGVIVYLADRFRPQIVSEAAITAIVFGGASSFGIALLHLGLLALNGHSGLSVLRVISKLLFALLAGGLLTPLVCRLMEKIHQGLDLVSSGEARHVNA